MKMLKTSTILTVVTTLVMGLGVQGMLPADASGNTPVNVKDEPGSVKSLTASVTIDAPPESVWQTLTNYNSLKTFMPGYEKSQVTESSGSIKIVDLAVKISSLLPSLKYQVRIKENAAARQLSIQRVSGDFKTIQASYKMTPVNGGAKTLLTYTLQIDPGDSVPKLGITHTLKSSTEKTMAAVSAQCAGNYRKSLLASARH